MFLKNRNICSKIKISKVTDYAALRYKNLGRGVRFPKFDILTSVGSDEPLQPPLSLETPNGVQSVVSHSWNIQATSKGSDQTARMRRLI